jgi:hypothetical protein
MANRRNDCYRKAMKSHEKSKRTGRPTRISKDVIDEICESIRAGNYFEPSCIRAGVAKSTAYNWLKRAARELERAAESKTGKIKQSEALFVAFLDAVKKAEAEAEAWDVQVIRTAALFGHWQAAAWRLERKHNDRWGRRQAIEHSSPEGKPVRVQRVKIGDKIVEF